MLVEKGLGIRDAEVEIVARYSGRYSFLKTSLVADPTAAPAFHASHFAPHASP